MSLPPPVPPRQPPRPDARLAVARGWRVPTARDRRHPGARRRAEATPWPGHPDRTIVRHTVRPGETATGLAVRYHAWTAELLRLNRLGSTGVIHQGQVLRIPVVLSAVAPGARRSPTKPATRPSQAGQRKPAQAPPPPAQHQKHHPQPLLTHTHRRRQQRLAARRPDPRPGAPAWSPGWRSTTASRRTPRPRHRVAGVRLAAAPGLQRRRHRRDAGDAGHRPLDALVRRAPVAAARHPRQHPGRGADAAHPARVDQATTTTRSRRTTRASARCGSTATSGTPSSTSARCARTSAGSSRTGSPI